MKKHDVVFVKPHVSQMVEFAGIYILYSFFDQIEIYPDITQQPQWA